MTVSIVIRAENIYNNLLGKFEAGSKKYGKDIGFNRTGDRNRI